MEDITSDIIKKLPEFLPEDDWMDVPYEPSMLDLTDDLELPEYTIRLNGADCGPVTGVMCISGQSGNGKTMTSSMLMATYLGADVDGIQLIWAKKNARLLYVDTEMEKGNTQLVVARIAIQVGCTPSDLRDRLYVMRLREEEDHTMIWKKILRGIFELKPDVVFLDGMIDIIGDFNDNRESSLIIRKIMKLADYYQMPVWAVMHQNPGSDKLVGHQGSFMERKSTMVLRTQKVIDNEATMTVHFELKNGKQRGADIIPFCYHCELYEIDGGKKVAVPKPGKAPEGAAIAEEDEKIDPMMLSREDRAAFFLMTITNQNGITTRDLRDAIRLEYSIGAAKADAFILESIKMGVIVRTEDKRYRLPDSSVHQDEAPF